MDRLAAADRAKTVYPIFAPLVNTKEGGWGTAYSPARPAGTASASSAFRSGFQTVASMVK